MKKMNTNERSKQSEIELVVKIKTLEADLELLKTQRLALCADLEAATEALKANQSQQEAKRREIAGLLKPAKRRGQK